MVLAKLFRIVLLGVIMSLYSSPLLLRTYRISLIGVRRGWTNYSLLDWLLLSLRGLQRSDLSLHVFDESLTLHILSLFES